jgi:hypothetical protein
MESSPRFGGVIGSEACGVILTVAVFQAETRISREHAIPHVSIVQSYVEFAKTPSTMPKIAITHID